MRRVSSEPIWVVAAPPPSTHDPRVAQSTVETALRPGFLFSPRISRAIEMRMGDLHREQAQTLSTSAAARILGCSQQTVRNYVRRGWLVAAALVPRGRLRVTAGSVDALKQAFELAVSAGAEVVNR